MKLHNGLMQNATIPVNTDRNVTQDALYSFMDLPL